MNRKLLFGCLWLLITPLILASTAFAAGTRITAELGYGGYTVPGRWMPLRIKLDHPVNQGRIEVARSNQTGNGALVETFPANNPEIICPVLINEDLKAITVRIKSGSQVLGENQLNLETRQFPGHLFLTVNIPAKMQHAVEGMLQPQEPVLAVPVSIPDLPFSLLGYDSVSGIVMADPGPVLKPAQVSALRAWVSSGGCAVIYGIPPNSESVVQLLKITPDKVTSARSAVKRVALGFGKLVIIPESFRDDFIGVSLIGLQKLLELPPYRNSTRLTLGRCFPRQVFSPRSFDLRIDLTVILGLWMAVVLVVLILPKQNLVKIALVSMVMIILAVPCSEYLTGKWQRGYVMRCLAVNLPESGGTVIQGETGAGENSRWNLKASPWGADVDFGQTETGTLKPGNSSFAEWRHLEPLVFSTLQCNTAESYSFIGWIPGGMFSPQFLQVSGARQEMILYRSTGRIYQIPERRFQQWTDFAAGRLRGGFSPGNGTVPLSQAPLWLSENGDWLKRLSSAAPGETAWLVGRRTTGGSILQIRKANRMEFIWASPLPNGSF